MTFALTKGKVESGNPDSLIGTAESLGLDVKAVSLQPADYDFEKLQKSISKRIGEAWPPIYFVTHILNKDEHEFVAVVVYGSPNRPHFSGRVLVRVGPENRDASEEQYDSLVAQRNRKFRALRKLLGQEVFWHATNYMAGNDNGEIVECNEFYLTVTARDDLRSFPVDWITLSYDPRNKRYKIIITAPL